MSEVASEPFAPCPAPFNMARHVLQAGVSRGSAPALSVLGPLGARTWSFDAVRAAALGTATGLLR